MILIIGGAGYIGSHIVKNLKKTHEVLVLDNFSTGNSEAVKGVNVINGDFGDADLLEKIFINYNIEAVYHFAAFSLVAESYKSPDKYYENNVIKSKVLLDKMVEHKVLNIILSSTAAVYGNPEVSIIDEDTFPLPINPYGNSKLSLERMIVDYSSAFGLSYIIFRYFNAAGASFDSTIGESHKPETHLIPIILQHLNGERNYISIFGNDYNTKDGTCVRDYVHVEDLSSAHIKGLFQLLNKTIFNEIINLGSNEGYSVQEIIKECENVTKVTAKIKYEPRRVGDPPMLVSSFTKANRLLQWSPKNNLNSIIISAWNFKVRGEY